MLSSSDSDSDSEPDIDSLQSEVATKRTLSSHLSLIRALRKNADLSALRTAFHAASEAHILPSSVWHAHLTEEEHLATTPTEKESLLNIYKRALQDSQAPLLHASRIVFAAGLLREGQIERGVYDSFLREAEKYGAGYDDVIREKCATLPGVDSVIRKWPERYQGAKVEDDFATRTGEHPSSASFEESNPEFTISVYEKTVNDSSANAGSWRVYDAFLARMKHSVRCDVLHRACRSVPTDLELWRRAVAIADAPGLVKVVETVTPFVMSSEDLLGAARLTKEIWTRYLCLGCPAVAAECVKRSLEFNIPESVEWASATMHAGAILLKAGKREDGVTLVESVVNARPEGRWWLLYAGMMQGDARRRVYEHGLRAVGSIVEMYTLRDAWELFEVASGSEGLEERMEVVAKAVAVRDGEWTKTNEWAGRQGKPAKRRRAERTAGDGKKNKGKDKKKEKERNKGLASGIDSDMKVENGDMDKMEEDVKDREGKPTESNAISADGKKVESLLTGSEKRKTDGVEPRTVFLNNLPFSISESDLQEAFAFAGEAKQIRLPRRSDGATKGIAYIEFAEDSAVEKALTRHNKPIKGRAVWVRRSKPPTKGKKSARGGGGSGGRGGRGGRPPLRGGRRRVLIYPPRQDRLPDTEGEEVRKSEDEDEDVVMRDGEKSAGLGQDDFRKMFLK